MRQPHDWREWRRLRAWYLFQHGWTEREIAEALGASCGGAVNTSTTPKVQYTYSEMASAANHSRLASMTYPNGRVLTLNYSSGLNDSLSRLSSITDGSTTLESYEFLAMARW